MLEVYREPHSGFVRVMDEDLSAYYILPEDVIPLALALLKEAGAEIVEIKPMSQMIKMPQMKLGDTVCIIRKPKEAE